MIYRIRAYNMAWQINTHHLTHVRVCTVVTILKIYNFENSFSK